MIKKLEQFLAVAKSTGLSGIAIAAIDLEGCSHTAFHVGNNVQLLMGGTTHLLHRMNKWLDEQ